MSDGSCGNSHLTSFIHVLSEYGSLRALSFSKNQVKLMYFCPGEIRILDEHIMDIPSPVTSHKHIYLSHNCTLISGSIKSYLLDMKRLCILGTVCTRAQSMEEQKQIVNNSRPNPL